MIHLLLLAAAALATSPPPAGKLKYGPEATPLSRDSAYLRSAAAPDFWALVPFSAGQTDGRNCSVASTQMVVNAARAAEGGAALLTRDDALATQKELLKRVKHAAWKNWAVNLRGVTLAELGGVLPAALESYGLAATAETVHAAPGPEFLKRLRDDLQENEKSPRDFIVANFLQSEFTGDPEGGGHIAPVAAYDAAKQRVLILDPDREWYEPYWVSLATFQKGMATQDAGAKKTRGYVIVRWSRKP